MATHNEKERTMKTVARKAFRCTIDDEPGTLGQLDHVIYFFPDDGGVVEFTVEMAGRNVCLLGEVGILQAAALADQRWGGAAKIATTRASERG
jgi:hypothetical protein